MMVMVLEERKKVRKGGGEPGTCSSLTLGGQGGSRAIVQRGEDYKRQTLST